MRREFRFLGPAIVVSAIVAALPHVVAAQFNDQDAATVEGFKKRVHEYVLLHQKMASGQAKLPDKATPRQIDTAQRELGQKLITARATAKQGQIFGDAGPVIRGSLEKVFSGPEGAHLKKEITDEPHPAIPAVNARYPDEVPLSTMPTDVLKALPKLEEEVEYRFIGRHLILLDPHAHIVVDVLPNAMPA